MKKEDIAGLFIYLIMVALALVFGLTILQQHAANSGMERFVYFLYIFGAIVAGVIFNSIIYELGHVVGAKVGRYEILSVCILGFMFSKLDGKLKFRFSSFDGLTGETKIVPKENAKKPADPTAFLWFGTLFYLIELIFIVAFFAFFSNSNNEIMVNVAYFLLVIGAIGILIIFYNIVPIRVDSVTDGYRMKLVSNPKNKEAFNELLRVQHEIDKGNTDVEIKTFDVITNFTADLNLNKVYVLLDKNNFEEAEKLLDAIIEGKEGISNSTYLRARCQKIYIKIMTKSFDDARAYYEKEIPINERRDISKDVSMEAIRAYILMAGLFDKSRSECILALEKVYKAFKHTAKQIQKVEIKLFNEALNKIIELHKDWEFEDYLLTESK